MRTLNTALIAATLCLTLTGCGGCDASSVQDPDSPYADKGCEEDIFQDNKTSLLADCRCESNQLDDSVSPCGFDPIGREAEEALDLVRGAGLLERPASADSALLVPGHLTVFEERSSVVKDSRMGIIRVDLRTGDRRLIGAANLGLPLTPDRQALARRDDASVWHGIAYRQGVEQTPGMRVDVVDLKTGQRETRWESVKTACVDTSGATPNLQWSNAALAALPDGSLAIAAFDQDTERVRTVHVAADGASCSALDAQGVRTDSSVSILPCGELLCWAAQVSSDGGGYTYTLTELDPSTGAQTERDSFVSGKDAALKVWDRARGVWWLGAYDTFGGNRMLLYKPGDARADLLALKPPSWVRVTPDRFDNDSFPSAIDVFTDTANASLLRADGVLVAWDGSTVALYDPVYSNGVYASRLP